MISGVVKKLGDGDDDGRIGEDSDDADDGHVEWDRE